MSRTLSILILVLLSTPALAGKKKKGEEAAPAPVENKEAKKDTPAPADAGKGNLKPGQGVGRRVCLGSTSGIGNIEVTSAKTVGVATCNGELRRVFVEKGICKGKKARDKVEYGWQFADTTGLDTVSCP